MMVADGWKRRPWLLRRRRYGMRTSGWLNMRVRCHALSRRTEIVSDTTRLPGAPEWRIPSHKQLQPSGHFVNLGWDSRRPGAYLAPVQYQTPLPLCLTPLPCSPTPLPCSLTPLPCSPTPLPCLLACSPLLRSMIPSSPNPYQPHYRALPSDPIPSFLSYSTGYLPTLYLKCACHKHNDVLLRPLRRLNVSFVVVN